MAPVSLEAAASSTKSAPSARERGGAARPEWLHDQRPDDEEREEHVGPARRNRDRLELQRMEGEDERSDAGPPAGAEPAAGQDEDGDHSRQQDDQVGQVVAERSKPPHGVVQREDQIRHRAIEVPSRVAPVHQLLAEAPQQVSEALDPARRDGGVVVVTAVCYDVDSVCNHLRGAMIN